MAASWIISRRDDLLWLSGPAVVSFLILGVFYLLVGVAGFNVVLALGTVYFLWAVTLDGTHVFATYTRTYFDRSFRASSGPLLRYSLLLLAVGPVLLLGYYLFAGEEAARGFYIIYNRFGVGFAYFHLARQHWGFVRLYSKKNGEEGRAGRTIDGFLMSFGLLYPLVYATANLKEPLQLAETLPVSADGWRLVMYGLFGLSLACAGVMLALLRLSGERLLLRKLFASVAVIAASTGLLIFAALGAGLSRTAGLVADFCLAGFVLSAAASVVNLVLTRRRGGTVNRLKWFYMLVVLATHNIVLRAPVPFILAVICLTIFHNIQYHRIVLFYNRNKYGSPEARERHGYATRLTESVKLFALLALLFSASVVIPRALVDQLVQYEMWNYFIGAAFWGVAFHHYYIDGLIWKVGKSGELKQTLRLQPVTVG
jgi:hypothetical protein